jgi:hypothetical protein
MKPKLLLCLALVLSGGLFGCATKSDSIAQLSLSRSVEQIRTSILEITPLGTPIDDVEASIHTKLHPDSFYYFEHGIGKDNDQWPLGGEHHGKVIGCQIGSRGIPLLSKEHIDADWAFDENGRLADVFVIKFPDNL